MIYGGKLQGRLPATALAIAVAVVTSLLLGYTWAVRSALIGIFIGAVAVFGFLIGAVVGFLFAVPRNQSLVVQDQEPSAARDDSAVTAASVSYNPSTKLNEVADWLVKMLVGAGLVGAGQLRQAMIELGVLVSASVSPSPAGASLMAQLAITTFAILGFFSAFLWTRIRYSAIQSLADQSIQSELTQFRAELQRSTNTVEQTAGALRGMQKLAQLLASRGQALTVPREKQAKQHPDALRLREAWPDSVRERVTRFLDGSSDWDADPSADAFPGVPSELNGRRLHAELVTAFDAAVVFEALVTRTGGQPLTHAVTFLLHPSLDDPVLQVEPEDDDLASTPVYADGWFTIVAIVDGGDTVLSYSLKDLPGAPPAFTGD